MEKKIVLNQKNSQKTQNSATHKCFVTMKYASLKKEAPNRKEKARKKEERNESLERMYCELYNANCSTVHSSNQIREKMKW